MLDHSADSFSLLHYYSPPMTTLLLWSLRTTDRSFQSVRTVCQAFPSPPGPGSLFLLDVLSHPVGRRDPLRLDFSRSLVLRDLTPLGLTTCIAVHSVMRHLTPPTAICQSVRQQPPLAAAVLKCQLCSQLLSVQQTAPPPMRSGERRDPTPSAPKKRWTNTRPIGASLLRLRSGTTANSSTSSRRSGGASHVK